MTRQQILDEAEKCVCHDREQQYGPAENNFSAIADLWTAYLEGAGFCISDAHGGSYGFAAHDVAIMMCLLKIARIATGQVKADNYIDLAGYAACAGEIAGRDSD